MAEVEKLSHAGSWLTKLKVWEPHRFTCKAMVIKTSMFKLTYWIPVPDNVPSNIANLIKVAEDVLDWEVTRTDAAPPCAFLASPQCSACTWWHPCKALYKELLRDA